MKVAAVKTGMLATAATVRVVADAVVRHGLAPLVVDPLLTASRGGRLLEADALAVLRDRLLPHCAVFTPNLPEAEALLGGGPLRTRQAMVGAAAALAAFGPTAVLLKGGHLDGDESPDLLWQDGKEHWLEGVRLRGGATHGTGCTLSAAITAQLALGLSVTDACRGAKAFVVDAIAGGIAIGAGSRVLGPGLGALPEGDLRSSR
jgi:hydroxymethylpyrimidine/phosphomethylpyrimidine kinase